MATRAESFWRLLPDVRSGERPRFLFFVGLATLISLAQTMGLAGSEALFLAEFGAGELGRAFIAASVFTVLGSMAYALRVGVARNDVLFVQMLGASGVLLIGATAGVLAGAVWLLPALFCFWYLAQAVFLNHFWTFSGDFFDTISSKRLVPLFTVGASVGGAVGGLLAAALTQLAGAVSLIAGWGVTLLAAGAMLWLGRGALRRWGPLELEEADETSVESLRGALRFMGTSSLARWLVLAALGMVLACFLAQYLYSDIFARRFPDPTQLAIFFSIYFAVTNLIEILVETVVTPWLIRRIGVPSANLVHPGLMLLSFGGLAVSFAMPAGIAARMARELMENALAAPVRALVYNAMPSRFRGRMRAFVEGIVVYAGMAIAGLVLLPLHSPAPVLLCGVGAAASLFYLFAGARARRAYVATLLDQLRKGRLDLEGVSGAIGTWEASRLADLWEESLRTEGRRPSAALLQLIPALAARGILDPLVRAASHPNADVRRSSINALAAAGGRSMAGPLALALDDPDPGVRLAALRGLARTGGDTGFLHSRLEELTRDLDPRVRAEASLRAGDAGREILGKMIASSHASEATAALRVAPAEMLDLALERIHTGDATLRAAAIECVARLAVEPPLPSQDILALLEDPDPAVRSAAVLLASNLDDEDVLSALASHLDDPAPEVQFTAETVLTSMGAAGVHAVESLLRTDREHAVEAALRIVGASELDDARELLLFELRRHVRALWYFLVGYQRLPAGDDVPVRFLRAAFRDAMLRERRLAFRTLEMIESPAVVGKVERELRIGTAASRADALEILSHLGERESAGLLVLVHEEGSFEERARLVQNLLTVPEDTASLLDAARRSEVRWIRMGATACAPLEGDPSPEEEIMERLLALKQVELFANLSLEQLDALLQATEEADFLDGELICREGERGDALFLLIEGTVDIVKGYGTRDELRLARLEAVNYLGEMAILVDEPRSATAIARGQCQLLTLAGAGLKELILQMPEISFEIFRVLTARVRAAETRLSER